MWMTPTTAAANGRPTNLQLPVSDMPTKSTSSTTYPSTTPQHYLPTWEDYAYPTENPRLPSNAPVPVSNPPSSQRIAVIEYQWAHELVTSLLGQPPRSNFGGKFAIIADPDVDHPTRAQMFANQIRFQGIPISEKHSASRTQGDVPTHTLFFACRCEEGCRGRFLISAGDDTTHPYGVRGQRIGVGLYHP